MSDTKPIIESKNSYIWFSSALLCIATSVFIYFVWFDADDSLRNPYLDFSRSEISITCIFLPLAIGLFIVSFLIPKIRLYDDRIEVKKKFRSAEIYHFKNLYGWEKSTSNKGSTTISLQFQNGSVSLSNYDNSKEFEDYLVERKFPQLKVRIQWNIPMIIFTVVFFGALFELMHIFSIAPDIRDQNKPAGNHSMIRVVADKKSVASSTQKGTGPFNQMFFYAGGFCFFLHNDTAIHTHRAEIGFETNVKDTAEIGISDYDYEVKLVHTRQPTLWDKHFDWHSIPAWRIKTRLYDIIDDRQRLK